VDFGANLIDQPAVACSNTVQGSASSYAPDRTPSRLLFDVQLLASPERFQSFTAVKESLLMTTILKLQSTFVLDILLLLGSSPAYSQFTTVINVPPDAPTANVTATTQMNVLAGASIHLTVPFIDPIIQVSGELNVFGGLIQNGISINPGTGTLSQSGGSIEGVVYIDGTVQMHGGVAEFFGDRGTSTGGGVLNLYGDGFRLGDQLISGLENVGDTESLFVGKFLIELQGGFYDDTLNGILEDGTPFSLVQDVNLLEDGFSVVLHKSALPTVGPTDITISASTTDIPLGIRSGQTLTVESGGVLPRNFQAGHGSKLIVETGGLVRENLKAVGAEIEVREGTVVGIGARRKFYAFEGTSILVESGSLGLTSLYAGSSLHVTGGTVGPIEMDQPGAINISGGHVVSAGLDSGTFFMSGGSIDSLYVGIGANGPEPVVEISGGNLLGSTNWFDGGQINLVGRSFALGGIPLELEHGVPFTIDDRDIPLTGILKDGSPIAWSLTTDVLDMDYFMHFSPDAQITVTLVPEPATALSVILSLIVSSCVRASPAR
jgi:hypothetical protein